jgi:small-conductance mechanosensitive channel
MPGPVTTVAQLSFEAFRSELEAMATTEGRIVASVVVLVLAVIFGAVVLPALIRILSRAVFELLPEQAQAVFELINDYLPTNLVNIVVWFVEVLVLFTAVIALLVVWGLVSLAATVVEVVGLSVPLLGQFAVTVGLLLLAYIVINALEEALAQFSEDADRITRHQKEIMLRVGHVAVLAVTVMGILTLWGLDLSGLLVGAGFLGIVVGLAARQTLGSMIAGFVLMFSRPFAVGDWVEVAGHEGIVTNITIMNTRLHNVDGESVYLPNDAVSQQAIRNFSSQGRLRLRVEVGIDYETDPDHAERVALTAISEVDHVSASPSPRVIPTGFGDSAILLELRFWIDDPTPRRKWNATAAVVHAVKERFDEEGITIPFPQRELSGRSGGVRVHDGAPEIDTPAEVDQDSET